VVVWFEIIHRVVPGTEDAFCNAPVGVGVGFGSSRRALYLARHAGGNACVRQQLVDHHDAHLRAIDETVDRFVEEQHAAFGQGVTALKVMPAPAADIAIARWNEGVDMIVTRPRRNN